VPKKRGVSVTTGGNEGSDDGVGRRCQTRLRNVSPLEDFGSEESELAHRTTVVASRRHGCHRLVMRGARTHDVSGSDAKLSNLPKVVFDLGESMVWQRTTSAAVILSTYRGRSFNESEAAGRHEDAGCSSSAGLNQPHEYSTGTSLGGVDEVLVVVAVPPGAATAKHIAGIACPIGVTAQGRRRPRQQAG
jgi:hypothetical protein